MRAASSAACASPGFTVVLITSGFSISPVVEITARSITVPVIPCLSSAG